MAATNISRDESALLARKVHITINPDSFLVYLNLGYNNFHGLFEGMTRLRSLRYIFLNNNFFFGRIPVWFGLVYFPNFSFWIYQKTPLLVPYQIQSSIRLALSMLVCHYPLISSRETFQEKSGS